MHPIVTVLRLFGTERVIGSYGVLLSVALLLGTLLLLRAARHHGLDEGAVIASLAIALLGGFAGALALHALVRLAQTGSLLEAISQPGLAYLGGLGGGLLSALVAMRALGLRAAGVLDLAAVPLLLAHAVGRIGCLLGGCCYGRPFDGPWAITYVDPRAPAALPPVPRHPSPLYEATGLLLLALLVRRVPLGADRAGLRFVAFLVGYAALRFGLEHFRGDAVRGLWWDGRFSTSQLLSLLLFALALHQLRIRRRSAAARL